MDHAILQKVESIIATPVLEIPLAGGDKTDEECTEEELAERKKQRKAMKKREKELAKQELKKKSTIFRISQLPLIWETIKMEVMLSSKKSPKT